MTDDPDGTDAVLVYSSSRFSRPNPEILLDGKPGKPDDAAVLHAVQQKWKGAVVVQAMDPGQRYPRIWRGDYSQMPQPEIEKLLGALNSTQALIERFRRVARTVEPDPGNRSAFGQELRHLQILAATEVESAWKGILLANNFPRAPNDRYTTEHYCTLIAPLRLKDWKVSLTMYPGYGQIVPFDT